MRTLPILLNFTLLASSLATPALAGPIDRPHAAHWCAALLRGRAPGQVRPDGVYEDDILAARAKLNPALLINPDHTLIPDPIVTLGRLLSRRPSFGVNDMNAYVKPRLVWHKIRRLANELDWATRDLANRGETIAYGRAVRGADAIASFERDVRVEAQRLEDAKHLVNTPYWRASRLVRPLVGTAVGAAAYVGAGYYFGSGPIPPEEWIKQAMIAPTLFANLALLMHFSMPWASQVLGTFSALARAVFQSEFDPDRTYRDLAILPRWVKIVTDRPDAVLYESSKFRVTRAVARRMMRDAPARLTTAPPEERVTEGLDPGILSEVRVDTFLFNEDGVPTLLNFVRIRPAPPRPPGWWPPTGGTPSWLKKIPGRASAAAPTSMPRR